MNKISKKTKIRIDRYKLRFTGLLKYIINGKAPFKDVHTYCMFLGFTRSGHTLIGALLDAHPEIVIAHEVDVLWYLRFNVNEIFLYNLLLKRSQDFARTKSSWSGYSYHVPGQWQGRYKTIKVIGDKKGSSSVRRIYNNNDLYKSLTKTISHPMKFIHVVRNPFDNITTMSIKKHNGDLRPAIDVYFFHCDAISKINKMIPGQQIFQLRSEDFISNPRKNLNDLCDFLIVETMDDYIEACASIVFKSPRKTREKLPWSDENRKYVQEKIDQYPYLKGYSFNN